MDSIAEMIEDKQSLAVHRKLSAPFHSLKGIGHSLDEIEEQCTSKVLVILTKHHVLSDYTILSEYIESDPAFSHSCIPFGAQGGISIKYR